MKKTKLIFIRHGESLGNATRTMCGQANVDLSKLGYLQAEATAMHLREEKIDAIYSSDLLRAMNTALPHARLRNTEVISDVGLREVYLGEWENKTVDWVMENYGRSAYEVDWIGNFGTFTFPSGESVWGSGERFKAAVEQICAKNPGRTVLIVAHAAVIRAFFAIIYGYTKEETAQKIPFPSNASYSVASFCDGVFTVEKYSCDEHLKNVGVTKLNW